jgi:SWIM zinc finger
VTLTLTVPIRLLASTNYQGALTLIDTERRWLNSLVDDEANKPYVKGGIVFITYLSKSWMQEDLWRSWSAYGRNQAASRLGIPIEGVLPTTNHLESFNRVIKKKHLSYWQHSGYRLRFDVLIFHLIRHILPFVFAQVRQRDKATAWRATRFTGPAGGGTLPSKYASGVRHNQASEPLAWFEEDTRREGMAIGILQERRLLLIVSGHPSELWATCATSLSNPNLQFHERYWLTYNIKGTATCTCPDWLQRGGACKHLCAFRLHLLHQVQIGHLSSVGHFPVSLLEAQDKYAALKQESNPPTIPVLLSIYPNGYTQPIPPPTMVPSVLSENPPYKEMTDVPTLIDMELEIVAQMEMNDDTEGSDPGDNSDRDDDRSLV